MKSDADRDFGITTQSPGPVPENVESSLPKSDAVSAGGLPDASSSPAVDSSSSSASLGWFSSLQWVPTSMKLLEIAESTLLKVVKAVKLDGRFVGVKFGQSQVWTLSGWNQRSDSQRKLPLVLVHGFGGGSGLWAQNFTGLVAQRTVHSFDLLGFGRSSRPKFSTDPTLLETEWVTSIEDWRKEMKIEKMILLGHSLGGFLASSYALEHPERVRHLILVDPWGFPSRPPEGERQMVSLPTWVRTVARVLSFFNPLSSLRAAGPYGRHLVRRTRPDLGKRYAGQEGSEETVEAFYDYVYHCNVQHPSGEIAFKNMSIPFGWAKRPMIERLPKLHPDVPVTFIYGSRSWIDSGPGYEMQHQLRPESYVDVQIIRGAGHHVYADRAEDFNETVNEVCWKVEKDLDSLDMQ